MRLARNLHKPSAAAGSGWELGKTSIVGASRPHISPIESSRCTKSLPSLTVFEPFVVTTIVHPSAAL